mgnify:CR=1 FL=1
MRTRSAFTLMELLVVIGILTLLAGIILAVLPAARQRSYEARCMSNLHQLGLAFAAYQQDWGAVEAEPGRFYEPWQLGLPPKVMEPDMEGRYLVYIGTFELWQCPLAPEPHKVGYGVNYLACFDPNKDHWDPDGACGLWKHAVYRLGQEAFLLLDLEHHWRVCIPRRSGTCPIILLNLNHEVRRFMERWDASLKEYLWEKR